LEVIMPIQFVGPALQGASLVGRAIPVLQNLAGSAALGGLTSVVGTQLLKPKPTGKEKLYQAWGTIPDNIYSAKGGGFAYRNDNNQPSYKDAQGNIYDAVSGRPLYPAKVRPGGGGGGGGGGNAGYSDPGFRPIGGTPAERAQAAETSRVAQLTAQDPELQRYDKARAAAKTQEEMNAARDIGMQIWQQKYGNTPMAQPGGAVGVTNPLMRRTFGYQTGSAPGQQMGEPTLGPSPLIPQVDQALNPASPNFIGGEGAPLMNFADPRFENISPDEFQKLLNQVNKK
jgi:hypothetical protein